METKMITIPFEVELAKKIQAGTKPGKIVTRGGKNVRVVCWDMKAENSILVLIKNENDREDVCQYPQSGKFYLNGIEYNLDLMLQVPEWTQFKEGDVIYCDTTDGRGDRYIWLAIMKGLFGLFGQVPDGVSIGFYFAIDMEGKDKGKINFDGLDNYADYVRLATEEEKQQLIDALKQSTDPRAKEYLKRFFGIEEKEVSEQKLDFLQPVLVRANPSYQWLYGNFTHMSGELHFVSGGIGYKYCIPYTEQTKHLLGTTDNWEAQQ